jgi:hypothetical protein
MRRSLLSLLFVCTIVCAIAGSAGAQTEPPAAPTPAVSTSSGGHGPIGVGGILFLSGPTFDQGLPGLSIVYDPGMWHIDTLLALSGGTGRTDFEIGGRFWYHLASSRSADFSGGAGLAYEHLGGVGMMASQNFVLIEIGALIRIFITPNVAIGTATGLTIGTADADGYQFGPSNLIGAASVHYFF